MQHKHSAELNFISNPIVTLGILQTCCPHKKYVGMSAMKKRTNNDNVNDMNINYIYCKIYGTYFNLMCIETPLWLQKKVLRVFIYAQHSAFESGAAKIEYGFPGGPFVNMH